MSEWVLALHGGSHNSNIALARDGVIVEVIELERLTCVKDESFTAGGWKSMVQVRDYLFTKHPIDHIETLLITASETPLAVVMALAMYYECSGAQKHTSYAYITYHMQHAGSISLHTTRLLSYLPTGWVTMGVSTYTTVSAADH